MHRANAIRGDVMISVNVGWYPWWHSPRARISTHEKWEQRAARANEADDSEALSCSRRARLLTKSPRPIRSPHAKKAEKKGTIWTARRKGVSAEESYWLFHCLLQSASLRANIRAERDAAALVDFSLPRDVPGALGRHSNAGLVNLNDARCQIMLNFLTIFSLFI